MLVDEAQVDGSELARHERRVTPDGEQRACRRVDRARMHLGSGWGGEGDGVSVASEGCEPGGRGTVTRYGEPGSALIVVSSTRLTRYVPATLNRYEPEYEPLRKSERRSRRRGGIASAAASGIAASSGPWTVATK